MSSVRAGSAPLPSRTARLAVGALGLSLVILVCVAWGTGLVYLATRLGLPAPVRPALVDGVHIYSGLVGGVFVVAKVLRVGLRHRVPGVAEVQPWQRWISWTLLVLYAAVVVSGVLLVLPLSGQVYGNLVDLHLLTSVWALLPTTWHVWHYRRRATPYLSAPWRRRGGHAGRYWLAMGIALAPSVVLVVAPRAVSQLPQLQQGTSWTLSALPGHYVDALMTTADGTELVAAGDALYTTRDGVSWTRSVPPALDPTAEGQLSPALDIADGHANHEAPLSASLIHTVALAGGAVYVGTNAGLFGAAVLGQPLRQLAFDRNAVRSLAIDPSNPDALWAASASGPMFSPDAGVTWTRLASGLAHPTEVATIAYAGERIFASDRSGVYEWNAPSHVWQRRSTQRQVVAFAVAADGVQLYAFSPIDGIQLLQRDRWTRLSNPGQPHLHVAGNGGHIHVDLGGVAMAGDRIYVAGTQEGITASPDGGQTWTQLAGGLAEAGPTQLTIFHGQLWAATSRGLYRLPLGHDPAPTAPWWAVLIATAAGLGLASVALGGLPRMPGSARRPVERPDGPSPETSSPGVRSGSPSS